MRIQAWNPTRKINKQTQKLRAAINERNYWYIWSQIGEKLCNIGNDQRIFCDSDSEEIYDFVNLVNSLESKKESRLLAAR